MGHSRTLGDLVVCSANLASFRKKIFEDAMTLKFVQGKNADAEAPQDGTSPCHTASYTSLSTSSIMPFNSSPEPFADKSLDPHVRGFLHRPAVSSGDGFVLTHGAGSNAQAPLLVALAEAFSAAGVTVLRCDLPFRQSRPYGPPRPGDAAHDREGLKHAVAALRKLVSGRIFLGGHSYGGRQSTMLCAEEPGLAEGLLLFSYPLHPPRKPEQLRTQHLPKLQTPALFVCGTRDPFGSPGEIQLALSLIPAKTLLVQIDGAGHDLGFKGKARRDELPAAVLADFQKFFG
jgi:predicted alpha/beta-hydrolase family hydrolase